MKRRNFAVEPRHLLRADPWALERWARHVRVRIPPVSLPPELWRLRLVHGLSHYLRRWEARRGVSLRP